MGHTTKPKPVQLPKRTPWYPESIAPVNQSGPYEAILEGETSISLAYYCYRNRSWYVPYKYKSVILSRRTVKVVKWRGLVEPV